MGATASQKTKGGGGFVCVCVPERGHQEDGPVYLAYSKHSINICGMMYVETAQI